MKPLRLLLLLVFAASCAPSAPAALSDAERTAITQEVREVSLALVRALNEHDPEEILAFYQLDPGFTYVGCTDYMFGGDLFGNIVAGYHRTNPDASYAMGVQSVRVLGRDAAVVSLQGPGGDLELFSTRVLQRSAEGRWLITYEHESWPGCSAPTAPHPGTAPGDTIFGGPVGGSS